MSFAQNLHCQLLGPFDMAEQNTFYFVRHTVQYIFFYICSYLSRHIFIFFGQIDC